jgi:4a-hydroxytetrahydrobiopterin dehydratase
MKPINSNILQNALRDLPGWSLEKDQLVKQFSFGSFREAISFIVRVGFEAEAINHHPEISNTYNKVEIALCTHDAGNRITELDVELAKAIEHFSWV